MNGVPKSRGRKRMGGPRRAATRRPRTSGAGPTPRIDDLVRTIVGAAKELLDIEDPLEAELWASSMLGTFYKLPLPLHVRDKMERELGPAIVAEAERRGDPQALGVLRALAAVAEDRLAREAGAAAERLALAGIPDPTWASELGSAELVDAWVLRDPFDDQAGYYATFRYPGRRPHTLMALYDENLGGIVKDAFARVRSTSRGRSASGRGASRGPGWRPSPRS
jgi:hypothetical protein